jgi:ribose transport system substrate-binding protein
MNMTQGRRRPSALRPLRPAAALLLVALGLVGCASEEEAADAAGGSGGESADTEQVVRSPEASAGGEGCTLDAYAGGGLEALDLGETVVGFSQSEAEANPFRIAETQSIRDEAEAVGVERLLTTNANSDLSKQIADIQDMLAQGAEALIVAPLNSDGLEPALDAAREQGVPVLTIDRKVNATHCEDYVAFIGSDFYQQGERAAQAMIEATGGEGQVAILLGAPGNNVTDQRLAGFVDVVEAEAPGLEIVAQQTGNFVREEGQEVMEQLIQANPEITAVYAHNDEMALGAIVALKDAGRDPGPGGDVVVVSVDGTRNAVQAIVDGDIDAVIESNPRFGPLAFETLERFLAGEPIPEAIVIEDREYDESNAESELDTAY